MSTVRENLFLYKGHKVKICLNNSMEIEDELVAYDETGITLLKYEEKVLFDEIEELVYCGELTSFNEITKEGIIDNIYRFSKNNFQYSKDENGYKVYCKLSIKPCNVPGDSEEAANNAFEIRAVGVEIVDAAKNILDSEFLQETEALYFLKNNEKKAGIIRKKNGEYTLRSRDGQICELKPADVVDIHRVPQKNDFIKLCTGKGEYAGLVVGVGPDLCTLLAEESEKKDIYSIFYNDIDEIRYFGMVKSVRDNDKYFVKNVSKLYGNPMDFGINTGCDEENLKPGSFVSFCAGFDKQKYIQGFEAKCIDIISEPKTEQPIEKDVPVMVRAYEENSVVGNRFRFIFKTDYDENMVHPNTEKFVYADDKNSQSNILKKKLKETGSEILEYPAWVDIYEGDRYAFCEKAIGNNNKGYGKKFLVNSFRYNEKAQIGFVVRQGRKDGEFVNIRQVSKENGLTWSGGYKDFATYLASLKSIRNGDYDKYDYHVVYTLKKATNPKFKYEVKTISFVQVEDGDTGYEEMKERVSFNTLWEILAEKYGEMLVKDANEYKFGFINNYPIDKDTVKLFPGYKPKYEKNSDDTVEENTVEVLKENLVLEEEPDTDYVKYLVAYLADGEENKCFVVTKYNFNYCEFAVNAITEVQLVEDGVEITTRRKRINDLDKQMKEFDESIKAYKDELVNEAPQLAPDENFLVKTENGYELQVGRNKADVYEEIFRFGILTSIDPKQEYGYIDWRLRFSFDKLSVPAFNCYTRHNRRNVLICYCCDESGRVSRVQFPTKEMISYILWDARNCEVKSVEQRDSKEKREYVAKLSLWKGEEKNAINADYYFSGDDDAVVKKLANNGELPGKYVFVKTILGHSWDKNENKRKQKTSLPCYVIAINMQVEELFIAEEKGRYVARRNHNTFFPINGLINETISRSEKRELQLKIDETGYGLEVNKNTDESSEEFLKKNPYEKAAQGEAIQWDSQEEKQKDSVNNNGVYFKREEEETIWKVIADSDKKIQKSGTAVILYGQKRCGKTSLVNKIISEIKMNSKNTDGIKPIIIQRNNIKDILEISKESTPKDSAEKLYRDILREVVNNKDAVVEIKGENIKHIEVLQRSQKDELEKYDWTPIFKTIISTLKNPMIVVMDEFTDVCESILAKYEDDWKQTELAKKEFDFISVLKECGIIQIIIGHENMHTALNELRLTNAISAKADPIELTCFSDPSAEGLIRIPMRNVIGYYDPYGDIQGDSEVDKAGKKAVERMMYVTGKNPNILMKLCDLMYKHYGDKKNYIRYSLEKKVMSNDIVDSVIDDWMGNLVSDKADTLFDMILREPADDWFFNDNAIYRFVFAGCKATESLAYIYLECAAKRYLECGMCEKDKLHIDALETIQKQLENKYAFVVKHARRNKGAAQNAEIYNQLTEEEKSELIQEMISRMEEKLSNRRIINITNGNVEIVMKLFIEYVKKHKM